MSHFTRTKNVIQLAQPHSSLRFLGRPVSSIRSFYAGPRIRSGQVVLDSKAGKDESAPAVNKIRSTKFSMFTRNKTTKGEVLTEDTEVIASLNSLELSGPNSPIKIQETPGKGYGVFATRSIPTGTIILAETPLVQSSTANKVAIEVSCALLDPKEHSFFRLFKGTRKASEDDSSTIQIWNTNQFNIPHELNIGCLYAKASLMNHSCEPNADYTFTKEKHIVITTTRDIEEGEEVAISYVGPEVQTMPVEYRKTAILERSGFECQCDACVGGRRVKGVPRFLTDRHLPFPMEQLSDIKIFNVSDEISRRGAIEANKLVEEWAADFRKRGDYWQTIMENHARTKGDATMFSPEIVQWMTTHIVRTHNQWLGGQLQNKLHNKSLTELPDKLTIHLDSKTYIVPEDILVPYLNRMMLRAKHRLLNGSASGVGLLSVQKLVRGIPGKEHDLSYECAEVVRGVEHADALEAMGMDQHEMYRMALDGSIERHMNAGFGKGFFKK
ncbi:hypothetical protein EG328_001411 [Venturia inaequalis]|uniref:SET domain-containing protein n=1 Tax=Venturia inaequalis TaxID=5025 RepID=A0A8H3UYA8_VENIN|nr:hypothetical protein EG328_001411 [Venturia inaequalis]